MVEDFHYGSLASHTIEPMAIFLDLGQFNNASIKLGDSDHSDFIAHLQTSWDKLTNRSPLEYYFVDEWYQALYGNEHQLLSMTLIYSCISILLCLLGLYGMTALVLQGRRKEMGIRRVLGANFPSMLALIGSEYWKIIILSCLLGMPLAYFFVNEWLKDFAYTVFVGLYPFALSGTIILILSAIVISILTYQASTSKPSITLKE